MITSTVELNASPLEERPNGAALTTSAPFLKWAGGKRWLAKLLTHPLHDRTRHVEPFAGSASMFFAQPQPTAAQLSDSNADLMNTYAMVRDEPDALIRDLQRLEVNPETYRSLRLTAPVDPHEAAVRFIYLNRTAFNGLYRVNRQGTFNVPYGCRPGTTVCDPTSLRACSSYLQHVELLTADFRDALAKANAADHLYIDPPFTIPGSQTTFARYTKRPFNWTDQVELASMVTKLANQGASALVSNAIEPVFISLYPKRLFSHWTVVRQTNMSARPSGRGTVQELLITTHDITLGVTNDVILPYQPSV